MAINLAQYYNRFNENAPTEMHLFRAGYAMQSAEFNEVQSVLNNRLASIADAILKNGDVVKGAGIVVNENTGSCACQAGQIYLRGAVRGVPTGSFTISTTGTVLVGIYLTDTTITELEDSSLRDPAIGMRNYAQPGAGRLMVVPTWGWAGDGGTGEFYPVYTVVDGIVLPKNPPPDLDAITSAIAQYDRDSAGDHYTVEGLDVVRGVDTVDGQVFVISQGKARVNGYAVTMPVSRRIVRAVTPDLATVTGEPHVSSGAGSQTVTLNNGPVSAVTQVLITAQKTVTVTHGNYSGVIDDLPDETVLALIDVHQGGTTYVAGVDYQLTNSNVDWSLAGAEPAPGSTYSVTYNYIATATVTNVTETGFDVTGALTGTLIQASYTWKLPRIDRLCLSQKGEFFWFNGAAHETFPQVPSVPSELLLLASVNQTWGINDTLTQDGLKVVPMHDLKAMSSRVNDLYDLVALERLRTDAVIADPTAKKGVFVDSFANDAMRDMGVTQTAAIVDGQLTLAVDANILTPSSDVTGPTSLTPTLAVSLSQVRRTGSHLVNPYSLFLPTPSPVTITPAVDNWTTITTTSWNGSSQVTRRFVNPGGGTVDISGASNLLRVRSVTYAGTAFGPNELVTITFGDLQVGTVTANGSGVISGTFNIPANMPAGTYAVSFTGAGGSHGTANYEGHQAGAQSIYIAPPPPPCCCCWGWDPVAQTFTLDTAQWISAIDLWYTAKGTGRQWVQIRTVENGQPTRTTLAGAAFAPSAITTGAWTRITLNRPIRLLAGREYAIVSGGDDATTAIAIAELGKWDSVASQWVTTQPYAVGTMLSSSNASSWTAHQTQDLAFRLVSETYSTHTRTVDLGSVTVAGATDFVVASRGDLSGPQTKIDFELTMPSGAVKTVSHGTPVALAAAETGSVVVRAVLTGTGTDTPVLYPGTQVLAGATQASSTYITRTMTAGNPSDITVTFEALTPGTSSVTVECQPSNGGGSWTTVTVLSGTPIGDNWEEVTHKLTGFTGADVRIRLTLNGSATQRPRVRKLRAIVT